MSDGGEAEGSPFPVTALRDGEVEDFFEVDARAFGGGMPKAIEDLIKAEWHPDRIAVSRDAGETVGTAASEASLMTVPGLGRISTAMIVAVGVIPSHRRQGRLRALMRYQLDDLRGRGEIAAALFASEGGIYGRFGYGQATFGSTYSLDKRIARFRPAARQMATGRVRMITRAEAVDVFPAVYAEYAPTRPGELDRIGIDFLTALGDPPASGDESSSRHFFVTYEEQEQVLGYLGYENAFIEPPSRSRRRVAVRELCALSPDAYVALWDFAMNVDLTEEVLAYGRPTDEPIRWMLENPRLLRTTGGGDRTWLRLIEVGRCLSARKYMGPAELVIGIEDAFCPWNSGSYHLSVSGAWEFAEVFRSDADPDVELDAETLGSLYLGGVSVAALAEVRRIRELRPGAVETFARMFSSDQVPYCLTNF